MADLPLESRSISSEAPGERNTDIPRTSSEARLRAVVEHSPIGIVLAAADGMPLFTNPAFRRMLDLEMDAANTLDWVNHVHPDDRPELIRAQADLVAGTSRECEIEFRYHAPQATSKTIRARIVRVDSPHADFTFIGVGQDITVEKQSLAERDRVLREALAAHKMEAIGQLTGGIAHDFNNLLAVVVGFGDLALQRLGAQTDNKLQSYLEAIVGAGRRGRDLVNKMLAFSRAVPGAAPSATAVEPVAREVMALLHTLIPSSIRLEFVAEAATPPVMIAPVELHQALLNLIVNARDAIQGTGTISMSINDGVPPGLVCTACGAPTDHLDVRITVSDSGCGMDDATLAHIFEPFFSTKDVGRGTGLGLAVVHGVVHRAGGHIAVESLPGQGSRFHLLFAGAPQPARTTDVAVAEVIIKPSLAGVRVLLVDDEPSLRDYLGEVLEMEGVEVTHAANGRSALALAAAQPTAFDVVLTDQTMPEMTGIALLRALRAAGMHQPAVLCSGDGDAARLAGLDEIGATFLAKPPTPAEVVNAVRAALTRA